MKFTFTIISAILGTAFLTQCSPQKATEQTEPNSKLASWEINTQEEWHQAVQTNSNLTIEAGQVSSSVEEIILQSIVKPLSTPSSPKSITIKQSDIWENWNPIDNIGPSNAQDAPVTLSLGPDNYWLFARFGSNKTNSFQAQEASLEGLNEPLLTSAIKNVYTAKGGLEKNTGGYHAWQSKDMINWVHRGPITEQKSRWMTTAEYADGKFHFYYDFPNDQDPHLIIDDNLLDGKLGTDMGLAFKDPSHGSDCAFIRDKDGKFHVIYEDWSPINAQQNAWDSPLAGHAISADGIKDFTILAPAVDERTTPTGKIGTFKHPHWVKEDPANFSTNIAEYEIHEPKQNAFGDWAAITIGEQHYLFGDYDPADAHEMSVAWFTSSSLDEQFEFCGNIGKGHPDPDIMFAENQFYLLTQQKSDFTSPGPWVETVLIRVGVDSTNDGTIDTWIDWQEVKENYDYTPGFAKIVQRTAASIDLRSLPKAYATQFEIKLIDTTENKSKPILDSITLEFN